MNARSKNTDAPANFVMTIDYPFERKRNQNTMGHDRYEGERPNSPQTNEVLLDRKWCMSCILAVFVDGTDCGPCRHLVNGGDGINTTAIPGHDQPWNPQLRDAARQLAAAKVQLCKIMADATVYADNDGRDELIRDIKYRILLQRMRIICLLSLGADGVGTVSTSFTPGQDGSVYFGLEISTPTALGVVLDVPDGSLRIPPAW